MLTLGAEHPPEVHPMRHGQIQPLGLLAGSLMSTVVLACPDCPTARVVRASVMGEGFWNNLVVLLVPFLLIGALSALRYRVGEREGRA
jgi:uncharacterized membrane protein